MLTDEQIAALPGELLHAATWLETIEDRAAYESGWSAVKRAIQLVPEVQQARARRCGNCRWWEEKIPGGTGDCLGPELCGREFPATWSCADFTPRP